MLQSFSQVITLFGGPADYGRAVGMSSGAAKQAARRNSIAPKWWGATERAAKERSLPITVQTLAQLAEREAA